MFYTQKENIYIDIIGKHLDSSVTLFDYAHITLDYMYLYIKPESSKNTLNQAEINIQRVKYIPTIDTNWFLSRIEFPDLCKNRRT